MQLKYKFKEIEHVELGVNLFSLGLNRRIFRIWRGGSSISKFCTDFVRNLHCAVFGHGSV